jgi:muramoyltetrapeptide carboxypeptidase
MQPARSLSLPSFRKPRAVRPGDTIAVIAPAGPFDRSVLEAGIAKIGDRYRVRYDEGILFRQRYLAGDDNRRFVELTDALVDPEVKAVLCARGGYGVMRLLPKLTDWNGARLVNKPVVGFSDITALHAWLQSNGLACLHGPMVGQLGRLPLVSAQRLFSVLESTSPAEPLEGTETFVGGTAEGVLLGGNLSVFTHLLGTPYLPPLDDAVLMFEDIGEQPYRIDRMWTHLELAGVFSKVRGIVLGQFTQCEPRDGSFASTDVLRDLATATGLPCAFGFPFGHSDEINQAIPLGVRVKLDADAKRLTFLESFATI